MNINRGMGVECESAQKEFLRMIDHDLEGPLAEQVEAHVEVCPHCMKEWEAYRNAVNLLNLLDPVEVPDGLMRRIRARLEQPSILEKLANLIIPVPPKAAVAALASICLLLVVSVVWVWSPWSPSPQEGPYFASDRIAMPVVPLEAIQAASLKDFTADRILPGAEEIMRPSRALAEYQERRLTLGAALQDDIVLDLTGSEEVFDQIQGILKETSGRMFIMGIRQRDSGRVVRSRMVLQVPLEHYNRALERIESMGKVQHLFVDRDAVPLPPDRLRIRLVAVSGTDSPQDPLQEVSLE